MTSSSAANQLPLLLFEQFNKINDDVLDQIQELPNHIKYLITTNLITLKQISFLSNADELARRSIEIDFAIDLIHDDLNCGIWKDVPRVLQCGFGLASFVKCLFNCYKLRKKSGFECEDLKELAGIVDRGLLLGGPLLVNGENILGNCGKILCSWFSQQSESIQSNKHTQEEDSKSTKRLKTEGCITENFEKIIAISLKELQRPSLEYFNRENFQKKIPCKLLGCLENWKALTLWKDLNYLVRKAGLRTVPIEIGSSYVDENWSQKLMTIKDFVDLYFGDDSLEVGYLAQHNLFAQIPELADDFSIPEYCCLTETDSDTFLEPDINAWFGPRGTVSALHHDPKHNLLAQVVGSKQIVMYAPSDTEFLYPHNDRLLSNTSQFDPLIGDFNEFPLAKNAKAFKCLLKEGEILYIPPKWWHHVKSLERSFSVSFWWS